MDQKDEVKSRVDIVEVISSYLPLKKSGRNFAGLCPFHSEKTPSFFVSPERQAFKCFGCGEGGDVFTFLERIESWDFREALEEMAKKVGVKLTKFAPSGASKVREKLLEVNNLVGKFYSHLLLKHPIGEPARQYLAKRGIGKDVWEKFGLGYAPDSWEKTLDFLKSRKFGVDDLSQAGLLISGRKGFYDRFRNRIMFPLKDSRGTILGFAGRVIEDKSRVESQESKVEAKYINSPQTPIFNKGSLLFGLDVARSAIREKNEAVLVEGEFDVLSAHAAGVFNVVASKGTALTERQVAILARLCENVALCFDMDVAGDAAARRGIELLDIAGVTVKVVSLGQYGPPQTMSSGGAYLSEVKYKDPDEFAQKDKVGFKKAISGALNIYDYLIDSAAKRFDGSSAAGKKAVGREILPILAKITDDLVRAHYIEKLARVLTLDITLVSDAVLKKSKEILDNGLRGETMVKSQGFTLERYFLALLMLYDSLPVNVSFLNDADFEDVLCANFWKWLCDTLGKQKAHAKGSIKKIISRSPKEFSAFLDELYLVNLSPEFGDVEILALEIVKMAQRIKKASVKRQLGLISEKIKIAQQTDNEKAVRLLTEKFQDVSKSMKEV